MTEHVGSDLDEEGLQIAVVPGAENVGNLGGVRRQAGTQQVVGLGDQLHVRVLDAVVHHLDEMTRAIRTDMNATRGSVHLRRDRLEHRSQLLIGLRRAARHDARAEQRALLTARYPGANEVQALAPQRRIATTSVGEVRIPAIDHDVARLQQRGQLVDHSVRRPAGLHHDDHGTGSLQRRDEIRQRFAWHEVTFITMFRDQAAGPR